MSLIYLDRRPVYTEEKDAMGEEYFRGKMRYSMTLSQCEGKKVYFGCFVCISLCCLFEHELFIFLNKVMYCKCYIHKASGNQY